MQDLRDAKGFRSPYINSLNAAVKSTHIVGGDVLPVEAADGTKLYIAGAPDRVRFRLFYGIKVDGGTTAPTATDVLCCGVGSVFIGGVQTAIEVGNNVLWADSALMPRGQGWYTDQEVRYGEGVTWALVELTATHTVYIIACPESQEYWQCVPGAADKSAIALIAVIGTFGAEASKQLTVTQLVTSDIVYAGTGGGGPNYAIGPYKIVSDGYGFYEVAYFGTISLGSDGLPEFKELTVDDGSGGKVPVEAYRVPVATHISDHTNGVINGPL